MNKEHTSSYICIDKDKLSKHPQKLQQYLEGENVYPISLEIHPTERCNSRCYYCHAKVQYSSAEYAEKVRNGNEFNISLLSKILVSPPDNVIISGASGDPLLYKDIELLLEKLSEKEIPISLITNGVALSAQLSKRILSSCYNIRISVDAINSSTYSERHGVKETIWSLVLSNIHQLIEIRNNSNSNCRIGMGFLTGDSSVNEIEDAILFAKRMGFDYIDLRPLQDYRKRPTSSQLINELMRMKQKHETDTFTIWTSHQKYNESSLVQRDYIKCHGAMLYTVLLPNGELCLCCNRVSDKNAIYGNLENVDDWSELLFSKRKIEICYDIKNCPLGCRLHSYNSILENCINNTNSMSKSIDNELLKNRKEGAWAAI